MRVDALTNTTVVECATFVTGPYAAALLGMLGARVIKIESPPGGDPYRYFASDPIYSPNFAHLNRNKESVVVDLKSKAGRKVSAALLEKADVFIENFRPGVAARLGLGYEAVQRINGRAVYCSISAFGQTGPYRDKPGFDTLGQAMSGLLSVLTNRDQPRVMGIALSDYVTGISAAYGILGALMARQKSGKGCRLETSLLQATLSFIGETAAGYMRTGIVPDRMARVKNAHAFAFVTKDGLPLVVHCSVPEKFWLAFLAAVGRVDLTEDKRFKDRAARQEHYAELEEELRPVFLSRTRGEWLERLEKADVPAGALYDMAEVVADEQVRHLQLIEEIEHPRAGKMKLVRGPVSFTGLDKRDEAAPPLLGEHTQSVLRELGFAESEITAWAEQGAIHIRERGAKA
ncbi:MAG TPA: CoA transferase [Candidatus Acidoferrales bacterium]|nr:CoA transferase [Candidatus Acidoferrales bacterium]